MQEKIKEKKNVNECGLYKIKERKNPVVFVRMSRANSSTMSCTKYVLNNIFLDIFSYSKKF